MRSLPALVALLASSMTLHAESPRAHECKVKAQQQIDAIDKRMRNGYTSATGEKLRAQRANAEQRRSKCASKQKARRR